MNHLSLSCLQHNSLSEQLYMLFPLSCVCASYSNIHRSMLPGTFACLSYKSYIYFKSYSLLSFVATMTFLTDMVEALFCC